MKVLSVIQPGDLQIQEITKPVACPGHAVVKMVICGICGSDVTAYRGTNPTMRYPIEGIGHEGVGIIEEIGSNDKGLMVGDRVALEPYVPCNECHMCKAGRFNNCTHLQVCGVHKNGMMTDYFMHPVQLIYKLPDSLEFQRAALVEPLTIGLHGAFRARVSKGEHCVIFGAGTIGLLAAFACIHAGATPIVVDVLESRLGFAQKVGIAHVFNSSHGDVEAYLSDVTSGKMPEAMIDCTGSPFVIKNMHNYVCHGGRIALVGWPHNPVEINTVRCMQKELDVLPSRNSNAQFPTAIEMIDSGEIPVDEFISATIQLDEVEQTIQKMIENPEHYLKVLVTI